MLDHMLKAAAAQTVVLLIGCLNRAAAAPNQEATTRVERLDDTSAGGAQNQLRGPYYMCLC